jgi:long-chain acyl-CoA synthetase
MTRVGTDDRSASADTQPFPSLLDEIRRHVSDRPTHDAMRLFDDAGRVSSRWTYAHFWERTCEWAGTMAAGTDENDTIVIVESNAAEFIALFLGTLMAGRWALPVPPNSTPAEIARLVAESGAHGAAGGMAAPVAERHQVRLLNASFKPHEQVDNGGGIVLRTSGTTGIPKLVQRTISSLDAVAANVREATGLSTTDVVLSVIPAWHSYGVENVLLGPLTAGATLLVGARFDPVLCELWLRDDATVFPGVPMMFESLARGESYGDEAAMRLCYSAGSSLPAQVSHDFEHRWGHRVGQLYGATDVGSVTFNDPSSSVFLDGSVGVAMRGVRIRILDDDDRPVPAGMAGQVAISAPSMLSRYLGDQPLELVDGFLPMGDIGRLDERGRLTITGMMKFLIDVGGMKVNPLEVEEAIREYPDVADCAVVPIHVSESVWRVRAIVVPASDDRGLDERALGAFVRERLAPHKVPRVFEVRPSLPRSPTGKLLRRALEGA